jgi:hypothetical protein
VVISVEANASEKVAIIRDNSDAQASGRGESIRHKAFATSLVYRRLSGIGQQDTKTGGARSNRGSQTGRSSAQYEDVDVKHATSPPQQ